MFPLMMRVEGAKTTNVIDVTDVTRKNQSNESDLNVIDTGNVISQKWTITK